MSYASPHVKVMRCVAWQCIPVRALPTEPPRAGYVWGDPGSNECPANSVRITSAEACATGAAAMGMHWAAEPTNRTVRPRGCFWNEEDGSNVFLNVDAVGSGYPRRLLLCAVSCNGTVSMTLGSGPTVVSDGAGSYASSARCSWLIDAPGPIAAVFKMLDTDGDAATLTISASGAPARSFSGQELPPAFITNSTRINITFATGRAASSRGEYDGFELEVFALVPGGTWAPTAAPAVASTTAGPTYSHYQGASVARTHT
jgi:hypothetical protein